MEPRPPLLLLLLPPLWLPGGVSGPPAESVYTKVRHLEGETLTVQCPYPNRKHRTEGKVWCKVRKKKCELGFSRAWVRGPRYLLRDDVQARVVTITMESLRRQDSGRYWCMRNSSRALYPLMGVLLEVSAAPTTERGVTNPPLPRWANALQTGIVVSRGRATTSGPAAPFPTGRILLTPGLLHSTRPLPSTASGTIRPSSGTGYSFPGTATSTTPLGPGKTVWSQTVAESPGKARASSAGPASTSGTSRHPSTRSPTAGICRTSKSDLSKLPPVRHQFSDLAVLVGVLILLLVPVVVAVLYGFWKRRHMGSYSMPGGRARPWRDMPRRLEPPWKPACSGTT
ncbi:trem-like transcript 2 protein [Dasypus novemcinctus]|uniref:trem-like transcript 2 protein n=1 Tax=Dasypus novemcinctus TaxID=9361 RepID=UPI00265DA4CC|nr:trem-like transcript 2 protein [Dasypus novemcinctus]